MHEDMRGVEKMQSLYDKLLKAGIDENLLNKVFYQNAKRFFDKYLK
jgi:microsomal dipeptidase-like Zn-dependent dipeptidase